MRFCLTKTDCLKPDQKVQKRIARLGEICARFASEGIVPVHENCFNYGGMSWRHTLELLDAISSMRLVFDTGNPGLTPDLFKPFPHPNQDVMEAWTHLKPYVVHIHVKDGRRDPLTGKETYVYPRRRTLPCGRDSRRLRHLGIRRMAHHRAAYGRRIP